MVYLLFLLWLFPYRNIYLVIAEKVGGHDVVLQQTEQYLDKGHIIYIEHFF